MNLKYNLNIKDVGSPTAILVHGRGGNINVMKTFHRSLPERWNSIYLEAPIADPDIGGFSWWLQGEKEKVWEISQDFISEIKSLLAKNHIVCHSLIGIGFSQGGALLAAIAQNDPTFFRKIALLASFAPTNDDTHYVSQTASISLTQFLMIHGSTDQIVTEEKAFTSLEKLKLKGFSTEFFRDEGVGHKIGILGMKHLKSWLAHDNL